MDPPMLQPTASHISTAPAQDEAQSRPLSIPYDDSCMQCTPGAGYFLMNVHMQCQLAVAAGLA